MQTRLTFFKNKIFWALLSITFTFNINAQTDTTKLLIYLPTVDYPYMQSSYNLYRYKYLLSPSMTQAIDITKSFYNLSSFLIEKINLKNNLTNQLIIKPLIIAGQTLLLTYIPGGDGWLHEEFHRAILTKNLIYSYDQIYSFPLLSSYISITNVTDKDLRRLKQQAPNEFTRAAEAGIEGEYLLVKELESYNFFLNQNYPYWITNLNITLNSIFYVFICHTDYAIDEIDKFNQTETSVAIRDFIGLDFTAWAYDLVKYKEDYYTRGIHPSGIGINRYIKPNQLPPEAYYLLKKQGYLQFINLISPFLFGINKIKLNNNTKFNFALRHVLTSFGYNISIQTFWQTQRQNLIATFHLFRNKYLLLPAVEFELFRINPSPNTFITYQTIFGLQPKNLLYYDASITPYGYIKLRFEKFISAKSTSHSGIFIELSAKSNGWVQGEIEQQAAASLRFGFNFALY